MLSVRLFYFALLIGSGVFFVAYPDNLSLILMLVIIALPLFLLMFLLVSRASAKISFDLEPKVITKGTSSRLIVKVSNDSIVSTATAMFKITCKNSFSKLEKTETIVFPISAKSSQTIKFDVFSAHCGTVKIKINKVVFFDFFRLWSLSKNVNKEFELTVIPEIHEIEAGMNLNASSAIEADTFSKHKRGDDPSEVFKIRDYVPGDKLNAIHWKLSVKQDTLLIKEYSLPIDHSIVILMEFSKLGTLKDSLTALDGMIETMATLSNFLIQNEVSHIICWANGETNQYFERKIENKEDLFETIGLLLQMSVSDIPLTTITEFEVSGRDKKCSHLLYITPNADPDASAMLRNPAYNFTKTIINIGDSKSSEEAFSTADRIKSVYVDPANINESLYAIVL